MHSFVKKLITAVTIIVFMAVVVGTYMFLQYINTNVKMALIFLGVTLTCIGILVLEIILFIRRKKREELEDEDEGEEEN